MNNFNKNLVSLAKIVVLGLAVGVFTSYAMANWTEPPANPPANNAPEPLNVTNAGQVKVGGLTINSGGAATGILVPEGDIKFDLPGSKMLFLGTSTEPATTTNHNLRVYGNVNADYYCDRNGANCYTSSQMYGGGSGTSTDEKVKSSSSDTTSGYLNEKVSNSVAVTANKLSLLGDQATPGNNKCYGSNASGTKGWYICDVDTKASAGVNKIIAGNGITISPTTGTGYVTVSMSTIGNYYVVQVALNSDLQTVSCNAGDVAISNGMVGDDGRWGVEFINYANEATKSNPNAVKFSNLAGQTVQLLCLDK